MASYELLIGTGDNGTGATVEFSLINKDNAESSRVRPAEGDSRNNYQQGSIEIFDGVEFNVAGEPASIKVYFSGEKWRVGGLWLTDKSSGKTWYTLPGLLIGSKTSNLSPQTFSLAQLSSLAPAEEHSAFRVEISTGSGNDDGTNNAVFLKIFDAKGISTLTKRPGAVDFPGLNPINDFKPGTTQAAKISAEWRTANAYYILLAKYDDDMWHPTMVTVQGAIDSAGDLVVGTNPVRHFPINQKLSQDANKWVFCMTSDVA